MQFERTPLKNRLPHSEAARRVWTGYVHGHPDCWVVVTRNDRELAEWFRSETIALDAARLKICRAILDDDVLLIEDSDLEDGELFADLWGA
jgi:hypothetical protein